MRKDRRQPCRTCPWRVDVVSEFPLARFRALAPTAYDGSFKIFACHFGTDEAPAACAGFLLRNSLNNVSARLLGIAGGPGCSAKVELHPNYRAMAVANGVAPDDPILARCRADDE